MDFLQRALAALLSVILAAPASYAASALPSASVQPSLALIGVAAAVRGSVRAEAPGQAVGREIGSGRPLYLNDHIVTGPDGRLQILLLDQTTFTVGPDSDMVLDKFVYDPSTNAGKLSARLVKGVFRFVTGKIAKHRADDVSIALPTGTIGIRGTMVAARVDSFRSDVALLGPGPSNNAHEAAGGITVANRLGSVRIDRGGFFTSVSMGAPPAVPAPVSAGALRTWMVKIDAKTNSSGSSSPESSMGSSKETHEKSSEKFGKSSGLSTGASTPSSLSATESSGQGNASGVSTASTIFTSLNATMTQAELTAAQQISKIITVIDAGNQGLEADGFTTWDQLVRFQKGTGQYSGTGHYAVGGNVTPLNTFGFNIAVDFTHQQVGGLLANGQQSQIFSTGGQLNGAMTVGQVPMTSTSVDLTNGLNGAFGVTHAAITFHNSGGTVAGAAVITILGTSNGAPVSGIGGGTLSRP